MGKSLTPLRVGIIGCGTIVAQYLATLERLSSVRLVAVADLVAARAEAIAAVRPGVRALSIDALLADPEVDLVVNLTIPAAHAEVSEKALAAGKDVYTEKPLTADRGSGAALMEHAATSGLWVGCAPDTVLGTGIQTARQLVDDGAIGRPVAAFATMVTPGHERWHPNPDFYYQPGGGPLLDMGPYYLSALVHLLGPVVSVTASSSRLRDERTIESGERAGERVPVNVDTHITGVLTHASGVLSTLVMSFDVVGTRSSSIEVHGERGSLIVPDPNNFDGDVRLRLLGEDDWEVREPSAGYRAAGRGVGVHDRALADASREPRASGEVGFHVLDVMFAVLQSADAGTRIEVSSTCERPPLVPLQDL